MLVKTAAYDLPTKELSLGGGVVKILTGAPDPAAEVIRPDSSRAQKDVFRLCVLGKGVREDDNFRVPEISYEELYKLFDGAEEKSYSAKTTCFGYRQESGKFLPLEAVIHALYGSKEFSLEVFAEGMPEAVIQISSGNKQVRLMARQIKNGSRYFYPLLTSEQILSGMKPADSRGQLLEAGLLRTGDSPETYKVIFVIGQRNWNDINEPMFLDFADGGAVMELVNLPGERTKDNILYVGPLGGRFGEDLVAYPGNGEEVVEITAPAGALIRFNLDNDDFLNTARMYYKFTLDGEPCGKPSPEDGFVYNTRIPLFFGGGADYPSGVILPPASEHKSMHIRMQAHSDSYADSAINHFIIHIV